MGRNRQLVAISILAVILGSTGKTLANCPNICTQSTHHWKFVDDGDTSSFTYIMGMFSWEGIVWYPAVCVNNSFMLMDANNHVYGSKQLTADSSTCLGGGDDNFWVVPFGYYITCGNTPFTIHGFDSNGYQFTVSGESGDDSLSFDNSNYSDPVSVCGGSGNDWLYGGYDADYVDGSAGHDWEAGLGGSDNVRGQGGNDILVHKSGGTDYLRGEDNNDCVDIGDSAVINVSSSCGNNTDYYQNSIAQRPASCENVISNCCNITSGNCP